MDSLGYVDEAQAAFFEEAAELLQSIEVGLNGLLGASGEARDALLRDVMRWLHTLKGAASVVGLEDVRSYVHMLEERMRSVQEGRGELDAEALAEMSAGIEDVHVAVQRFSPSRALVAIAEEAPESAADGSAAWRSTADLLRVRPEKVDALHALVSELVVTRLQYVELARRMREIRDESSEAAGELRSFAGYCASLSNVMPARVHAELVSRLRRVSDATTNFAQGTGVLAREFGMLEAQASATSTSIEDGIRELRLVPLSTFFEEFTRVARETARETGKEVRLEVDAGSAELDRAVMMRLRDSIGHLVRNAVFHGIEAPMEREARGKPRTGVLRLEGRCERSRAVLRVIDDGAGIDREGVFEKAGRIGHAAGGVALGDDALLEVLAHPGFSTRETADALAGRGIGLDVVANAVRALDGILELSTTPGSGTVFTIEVPVTASTGIGLVAMVGQHAFGILLSHVERAIRVGAEDITPLLEQDTVTLEGAPVAVVPLGKLVGLSEAELPRRRGPALILRMGKQRLVVTVDDVPGEKAFVVRPLGRAFANASHLSGAAVEPDGSTLPVLHVPALFARAAALTGSGGVRTPPREVAPSIRPPPPNEACSVLVVDDSMTMRTLLRNILRADRYDVTVAHDGKAALEALASMKRCDLVITDLEMPRMNGGELCRAIRRSAHAQVPVMVVTSVGDPEEKRRALESGADAYMVKSDFSQGRFLETVARLSGGAGRRA